MRHILISLHGQIRMTKQMSWILLKMQGCEMKICTDPIHGISTPQLNWYLPKLGRMCCNPEKICRKNALALPQSVCLQWLCMLWLRWTGFGVYSGRGLCVWWWTYSAGFSQTLAAHESCRSLDLPWLPKLLEITFEDILPGRQQHNWRYTKQWKHPTILKFLAETTTMQ